MANGGVWNRLLQQGFTEQQIEQLMNLGVLEDERDIISQEMEMANRLRERQGPQGRFAGNTYVMANPMEFVGAGIDRIRGEYNAQQAIERQRQNAQARADARRIFLQQMGMGGGGAPAPAPPAATPPIQPRPAPAAAQTFAYGTNPGTPTTGWR